MRTILNSLIVAGLVSVPMIAMADDPPPESAADRAADKAADAKKDVKDTASNTKRAAKDSAADAKQSASDSAADAKQRAAGELDAGLQHGPARERLQRHADHQGEDQRRDPHRAEAQEVLLVGHEGDGRDHGAQRHARRHPTQIVGRPQTGDLDGDGAATHQGWRRAGLRRSPRLR